MKVFTFLTIIPIGVTAFSASSSFIGDRSSNTYIQQQPSIGGTSSKWTMYNNPSDSSSPANHNAWQVLSKTESWISSTLSDTNNPYARKEVSYVCENQIDTSMIISNIFRLLRQARERGEKHGEVEMERSDEMGSSYSPTTMRQTQVIVIPSNPSFNDSFFVFDKLINNINQARRNARDYITDTMLDIDEDDDDNSQWSVAINCAHLHPKYGERTPKQIIEDMKREDEVGEVDVNYEIYKQNRLKARQSPYPTVVLEVRVTPTPDFGVAPPPSSTTETSSIDKVSASDIQKLEALFGKSAHMKENNNSEEDSFWDAVGNSIEEVSAVTPVNMAQQWITANVPNLPPTAAFTESITPYVDEAYEFVFTNIAMFLDNKDVNMQFLILPHFLSSAATSFEKFTSSLNQILSDLPELKNKIDFITYHPEHIDPMKRSPMPILTLKQKTT